MIILGIDTATDQVSCAIGGYEGVLASFSACHGRRHAEILTPAIEFVSAQSGIAFSEVSAVAVDIGPGLFTGLRVGVATAKAMAQALRVPMIGLSSLDLLAYAARLTDRVIVTAVDARRGELFTAFYRQVPGGVQRLAGPSVCQPDDLANELLARNEEALLVGDGAVRHAEVFDQIKAVEVASTSFAHPSASALVELAHPKALREEFVQPWEIEPLYLRKADAEINWERRPATDGAA